MTASQQAFLIIEDQRSMGLLLQSELRNLTTQPVHHCQSLAEAKALIESGVKIIACLTDLNLPDAPNAESVELLKQHQITTVVLTATYSEKTRDEMFKLRVADYVIKDGPSSIKYAVQTLYKLYKNSDRTIYILGAGTKVMRKLQALLRIQRYQVSLFETYAELKVELNKKHPDLLLLDSVEHYKNHDIYDHVNDIRLKYSPTQLPMIACEASHHIVSAIKLMKYGVNDFFNTCFTAEEFYARVHQNIEQAEAYRQIEYISQTDVLSELYNRRYFFDEGEKRFSAIKQKQKYHFAMMIDIDYFKKINDTHGHQKGDQAIRFVSNHLSSFFANFLVARIGGEEFAIFGEIEDAAEVEAQCETLRKTIEQEAMAELGFDCTISLGLTYSGNTLEEAISQADKALYRAKKAGRNQLAIEF